MKRDIARVILGAAVAQIAGFGKAVLIAYYFGVGSLLDGYYLAQAVPAVLGGILLGFVQTGFLPVYSGALARGESDEAAVLAGKTLAWICAVAVGLSVLCSVASPAIVEMIAGVGRPMEAPAVTSLRFLAFLVLLNAVIDCCGLVLNAHARFFIPAIAPAANAVVASGLLAFAPDWGLSNLIAGMLVGAAAQIAIVVVAVRRAGVSVRWGRTERLSAVLRAGRAILPGLVFSNLATMVAPACAARIGEGAVAALSIANRFHSAIGQVLVLAVSTVLLPRFAQAFARNEAQAVTTALRRGFPMVTAIGICAVVWVGIAGPSVIVFAMQRGAFDAHATAAVGTAWLWLTVGLLPSIWGTALAKVLQSLQLGGTMSFIAFIGLVALTTFGLIAVAYESLGGLALSLGFSAWLTTVACAIAANATFTGAIRHVGGPVPSGSLAFAAIIAAALTITLWWPPVSSIATIALVSALCGLVLAFVGIKTIGHTAWIRR